VLLFVDGERDQADRGVPTSVIVGPYYVASRHVHGPVCDILQSQRGERSRYVELRGLEFWCEDVATASQLRLSPVTVLLGRNGTGKSTLLRLLGDPAVPAGVFVADLPSARLVMAAKTLSAKDFTWEAVPPMSSTDELISKMHYFVAFADAAAFAVREYDGRPELLRFAPSEPSSYWSELAGALNSSDEGFEEFVAAVTDSPLVCIVEDLVFLAAETDDVRPIARRLAVENPRTPLSRMVRLISESQGAFQRLALIGALPERLSRPRLSELEPDPGSLIADLEATLVPQSFDALFPVDAEHDSHWAHVEHEADRWTDEDGSPRDGLSTVLDRLMTEANSLLPAFVEGQIVLAMNPPRERLNGAPPVEVMQRLSEEVDLPLAAVSDGQSRWIAFALREAARRVMLLSAVAVAGAQLDGDGHWFDVRIDDRYGIIDAVNGAVEAGRLDELEIVYNQGCQANVVGLDEPELHLHPTAVSDVADWITRLGDSNFAVVVATHSPTLLRLDRHLASYSLVGRDGKGRITIDNVDQLLDTIGSRAEEAGFSPRDVFHAVRGLVLVEGRHDTQVLEHFFRSELQRHGLLTVPLAGSKQLKSFADVEILARSGIPLFVLFDYVRLDRIEASDVTEDMTQEERELRAYLHRLRGLGIEAQGVPYTDPDVLCALPIPAICRAYPHVKPFDWEDATAAYRSVPRTKFKPWLFEYLGLAKSTNPDEFLDRVLDQTDGEYAGAALRRAVSHLLSLT
jgi:hypothetical protein